MRPLVDYFDPDGWGDIRRTARLPFYDNQLGPLADEGRRLTTDELGFPNRPAGETGPHFDEVEVFVSGTSFAALADDVDRNLGARLEAASGRRVYNASWTGYGPAVGILDLLDGQVRPGQTIVWTILQRQLEIGGFRDVWRLLDAEGNWRSPSTLDGIIQVARGFRNWPPQLEARAESKSVMRRAAGRIAFALPIALDRGVTSTVRLATLTVPTQTTMLFFEPAIRAGFRDFESASGPQLVAAIRRVSKACSRRNVKLIVALIPDKFTFFAEQIEPRLYPGTSGGRDRTLPGKPLLESLRGALEQESIVAVDLTPILREFQASQPESAPLYRRDDSHWSDEAIEISAKHLATYLGLADAKAGSS